MAEIAYPLNTIWLKIQDSGFKIQDSRYIQDLKKGVSKKQYTSQLILGNQGMCPQYSYYKTFTSHKNWSSPLQEFFTKIPQLWPVVFSVNLKIRALTPRSSDQGKKLYKKDVCKNFAKFTHRKTPVPESLF